MRAPELGLKRKCLNCASPFFDLNRTPIVCPKCRSEFEVVALAHSQPRYANRRTTAMDILGAAETETVEAEAPTPEIEEEEGVLAD
jgi:uncharacterized protein (TIGR02300 family)